MRTRDALFVALFCAAALGFGCSRKAPPPELPPLASTETPTITNVQPRVDQLLAGDDNVVIRRGIDDAFVLIDLLLAEDRRDDAFHYLTEALRHKPWALRYQMLHAEMLRERGIDEPAREKAAIVLDQTEHDDLYERALALLDLDPLPEVPPIEAIDSPIKTLVLVPIGRIDRCVIYTLREELEKVLRRPVHVRDAGIERPPFARDPVQQHLEQVRQKLLAGIQDDDQLSSLLQERGIDAGALQDDATVITACRHMALAEGGTNALARFDESVRLLTSMPKQCNTDDLFRALREHVEPFESNNLYFIGITEADIYGGNSNFLFGRALNNGVYGVISYRRFTANFNDERPSRPRLVERTLKQALSSLGFMLGVPRCAMPTCARAYPHNLGEHDAKSTALCADCKRRFDEALGLRLRLPAGRQMGKR